MEEGRGQRSGGGDEGWVVFVRCGRCVLIPCMYVCIVVQKLVVAFDGISYSSVSNSITSHHKSIARPQTMSSIIFSPSHM